MKSTTALRLTLTCLILIVHATAALPLRAEPGDGADEKAPATAIKHTDEMPDENLDHAIELYNRYCSVPSDDPLVWEVRLGLRLLDRCASDHRAYLGSWPPSVEYLYDEGFMPVLPSAEAMGRITEIVELRGWYQKALDENGELINLGQYYPSPKSRILAVRQSTLKWQLTFRFPHSIATDVIDDTTELMGGANPAFWANVYTGEPAVEVSQDFDTPEGRIQQRGNYVVVRNEEDQIMHIGFLFPDNAEDE